MKILIADDDPTARFMLEDFLTEWGYEVVSISDGNEAWEILQKDDSPNLALLDWMMPRINGIELCNKIRERKNADYTYIILLTSKTEKEDIVAGLKSGADDFVSKPFNEKELKSRLEVGCRILKYEAVLKKNSEQLERYATQMKTLAEERAKQLVHADRMATIGVMSAGIVHEINNPLTYVSNSVQLLEMFWEKSKSVIEEKLENSEDNRKVLKLVLEDTPKTLEGARKGVTRIVNIVKGLKGYARKDEGEYSICNINHCIEEALEICHNELKHRVIVEKQLDQSVSEIEGSPQQIEQVLINLFVNASHAMESQENGILRIITKNNNQSVCITTEDTGPGIPDEKLEEIWDPFYSSKGVGKGTGLGLSISKGIIEKHGGNIRAENIPDGGARFIIELPFK